MSDTKMVKVLDYCSVIKGKIGIKKAVEGKYPLVTTAEERLSHNEYHFDRPSVIIPLVSSTGHGHASLKRIHYQEGKFAVGSILCVITPKDEDVLNAQFLYHYLDVYKEKLLVSRMRGMANVTLPVTEIENIEFPLLSTDKQKEWVSLFEDTTSYTGSLKSEITHQQAFLKKLRQAILQDAISGRLTEKWRRDNPDFEPASELLARIKSEKERLVKEKKIKKQKPLPPVTEDEIPFELPEGWVWCRTEEICTYTVDCPHSTPKFTDNGNNCIDTTCINEKGEIVFCEIRKVSARTFKERNSRLVPQAGDIIYSREGSIGQAVIIPEDFPVCLGQRVMIYRPHPEIPSLYLRFCIVSKFFLDELLSRHKGMGAKHVNMKDLRTCVVPVPSAKEMEIIVTKIEKHFAYYDELDQQIGKSQQDSELLMQAVLQEAFKGNNAKKVGVAREK